MTNTSADTTLTHTTVTRTTVTHTTDPATTDSATTDSATTGSIAPETVASEPKVAPSAGGRLAVAAIRLYQLARTGHTSPCRFTPTCSHYAVEAFERHGLRRGLRLTLGRLGRCRPGGPFGSDPVPE